MELFVLLLFFKNLIVGAIKITKMSVCVYMCVVMMVRKYIIFIAVYFASE